jgi:hypothetical protein
VKAATFMNILTVHQKRDRRHIVTYKGIVKGKTIAFEDPLELPEGTEVEVVVNVRPGTASSRAVP